MTGALICTFAVNTFKHANLGICLYRCHRRGIRDRAAKPFFVLKN